MFIYYKLIFFKLDSFWNKDLGKEVEFEVGI